MGPSLGEDPEVLQRLHHPFDVPEHGGQPQAEEHDEEEDGPDGGDGHLGDGLGEHDEGQPRPLHALGREGRISAMRDLIMRQAKLHQPTSS